MTDTLVVTGVHREELGFGDRVAALLDHEHIDVMRIPRGISHSRTGKSDSFYYDTQHREIYLQLRQQAKGQYDLLIDLHCGRNDAGRCADLYSGDERILSRIAWRLTNHQLKDRLRLVKILSDTEPSPVRGSGAVTAGARTSIPEQIWNNRSFSYVGLEVYLPATGEGTQEDWQFARDLIDTVRLSSLTDRATEDSGPHREPH